MSRRRPQIPVLLALLLAAGACGGPAGDGGETGGEPPGRPAGAAQEELTPDALADAGVTRRAAPSAQGGGQEGELPDGLPSERMVIRTGRAVVEVDSLEPAVEAVRVLAEDHGGYVSDTNLQLGRRQYREATLTLKVPSERLDSAVAGLEPLGDLQSLDLSGRDVTEEFVDVQARLRNQRQLEERLLELLETRTGDLEDVLAVERELARVRQQIERFEGRVRYLRSRVRMSTLTVSLREPRPIASSPGQNPIARALERAWRNFVNTVASFIAALGWLVPLAAVGLAVVWGAVRFLRPAWRRWRAAGDGGTGHDAASGGGGEG